MKTITATNLFALKSYFAGRDAAPSRAPSVDAPHLRRCAAAGLIELVDRDTVRLTMAGRVALGREQAANAC